MCRPVMRQVGEGKSTTSRPRFQRTRQVFPDSQETSRLYPHREPIASPSRDDYTTDRDASGSVRRERAAGTRSRPPHPFSSKSVSVSGALVAEIRVRLFVHRAFVRQRIATAGSVQFVFFPTARPLLLHFRRAPTSPPMTPGTDSPRTSVHLFPDLEALSRAATQRVVSHIGRVLTEQETYALALAGGSTPQRMYELLAGVYSGSLPWERVHLFWGDERCVSHDDPASNYRLARRTLIDSLDIPDANVHPIPETGSPEDRARAYAETLRRFFESPASTFDAALLGLGADGHTASVFPPVEKSTTTEESPTWVQVTEAPPDADVRTRITCSLPVLSGSSQALFLVAGSHKQEAVRRVLDDEDPSLPATHVRPRHQCSWFIDRAARPSEASRS